MRILHVYKTYYPDSYGGIEQVIYQLCHGCVKRGIESDVFTFSQQTPAGQKLWDDHKVIYNRTRLEIASTPFSLQAFAEFNKIKNDYDIINYHFPFPFMDVMHLTGRPDAKTVVTYHSDIIKQKTLLWFYQPVQDRFLKSVDSIIASSPNYLATSTILQRFKDKTSIIPFGLKPARISANNDRRNYWRQKIGGRFFLFVGAFRYYKGLNILLEAAARSGLPVVIAGGGPMKADLEQQAKSSNASNICFAGMVNDEDKNILYELCYGVVFPSHLRSEAFGVSLLEGAQFGRPLISCEIGTGTSYINIHHETGLVIAPGDSHALAEAMKNLWDNPETARRYGENAGKWFAESFTSAKMIDHYIDHYQQLLSQRSNQAF
ncbi:glycosyltransferase family 4 protein [Tatumella sp. UBA2305]|uniref:glycosyltransferase family 4 protein n=1 Tax=Tatumella sp. UBA2305 TaxID=1947647 RepID=UPI0025D5FCDD|nr:glycosyltransferase family 4 protein [Tatumella sp. UBA2305]